MLGINVATWFCLLSPLALPVAAQSAASEAYTPVVQPCPENFTLVRDAGPIGNQTLSSSESTYVQARQSQVIPQAWKDYLKNVEGTSITLPSYVSNILGGSCWDTPNFAIATSGGGYRASIFGAGVMNALDGRNASSNSAGLGGLLQTATYLSGLSGGGWLVTSLAQANFPTIQELIFGYPEPTVANDTWGSWNAGYNLILPSSNIITDTEFLTNVAKEIKGKHDTGYPLTLADYWSRLLARHFVNGTFPSNFFDESYTHGAGILWSSVAETESFKTHSIPFPIIVTDLDAPGQNVSNILPEDAIPLSNPLLEFNVFEMGSFDPMLSAFAPTKYLGTTNNAVCTTNYDQSSFLAASSSELFNELGQNLTEVLESLLGDGFISLINEILPELGNDLDVLLPSPFYGVARDTFISSNQTVLNIVDGGENGENIPLQPLLVEARGVDTILAIDATNDGYGFAAGSSLIATQQRVAMLAPAYSFPPVPTTTDEFVAQGLATRPTFFGCGVTSANQSTPLIIYIANGGPPRNGDAPATNTSTFQFSYSSSEVQAMLDQTFSIATQGYAAGSGSEVDHEWPACLACAVVDRARQRAGKMRSGVCESCFERYCWYG